MTYSRANWVPSRQPSSVAGGKGAETTRADEDLFLSLVKFRKGRARSPKVKGSAVSSALHGGSLLLPPKLHGMDAAVLLWRQLLLRTLLWVCMGHCTLPLQGARGLLWTATAAAVCVKQARRYKGAEPSRGDMRRSPAAEATALLDFHSRVRPGVDPGGRCPSSD